MKQVLFRIPGLDIPVYGFGVMVVLGFYVALLVCERRCRRERLDSEILAELAVWMLLGGLVGARAFYVIEYWGNGSTRLARSSRCGKGGSSSTAASSAGWRGWPCFG